MPQKTMASIIQVDYLQLKDIAKQFDTQADSLEEMNNHLNNQARNLQTCWLG